MCSVALFTFPPGRRLLIDSWSRSHLFWKFFVSDALSLPCECACVCVCVCVREMPYRCSKCVYVCVCVCCGCLIFTNSYGPLPSRNLKSACWSCSEHCMSTTDEQIRTGVLASVQNWVSFSCFCVFLCTKALGSRVPAEHSQVPVLSCEHERRRNKKLGKKKKGLINSYPFELSRGTWSQLDAAAFTGSHRRVWCPQKQQQQQQQQQLLSFCLSTSHAQTSTVLHRRMLFFFLCAEGREDDRQQQEHSKVLVSETALPVEAVREFSAVFFSHDLNSLHLKVQEV